MFREPASRSKLTPLWDGLAEASAAPATGKVPMNLNRWSAQIFSTGTGRLVCVRALLAQFRFFRPEISRLVHTGGKGRTPGCLILRANSGHGS
jgi:hypothetical protein